MGKLLLDTHAWIWLMIGEERIQQSETIKLIEAAAQKNELYVASISIWEVGMLESKGRIRFQQPCLHWVTEALKTPGLSVIDLSIEAAIESSRLPAEFHGDPADRILVATARALNMEFITQDKKILEYAAAGYVRARGFH